MGNNMGNDTAFHVGDRVVLVRNARCDTLCEGDTGTVVDFSQDGGIGVAFDKRFGGHSCRDKCKNGYGWYLQPRFLELEAYQNNLPLQCATDDLVKTMLEGIV